MNKKLTYRELEDLLPDYAFNRLDQESKSLFEQNVKDHPDLLKEIEQIRSVFSKVENLDISKTIDDKSRNISVKVIEKLGERKPRSSFMPKFAYPTLGVLFVAYLIFFENIFENKTAEENQPLFTFHEFENLDTEEMIYFLNKDNIMDRSADIQLFNNIEVEDDIEYFIDDVSIETLTENLTEDEFSSLIEEIYEFEIGS